MEESVQKASVLVDTLSCQVDILLAQKEDSIVDTLNLEYSKYMISHIESLAALMSSLRKARDGAARSLNEG